MQMNLVLVLACSCWETWGTVLWAVKRFLRYQCKSCLLFTFVQFGGQDQVLNVLQHCCVSQCCVFSVCLFPSFALLRKPQMGEVLGGKEGTWGSLPSSHWVPWTEWSWGGLAPGFGEGDMENQGPGGLLGRPLYFSDSSFLVFSGCSHLEKHNLLLNQFIPMSVEIRCTWTHICMLLLHLIATSDGN